MVKLTLYFCPASGVTPVFTKSLELQTPPASAGRAAVTVSVAELPEALALCTKPSKASLEAERERLCASNPAGIISLLPPVVTG